MLTALRLVERAYAEFVYKRHAVVLARTYPTSGGSLCAVSGIGATGTSRLNGASEAFGSVHAIDVAADHAFTAGKIYIVGNNIGLL